MTQNYNLALAFMRRNKLPIENQLDDVVDWYGIIMETFCNAAKYYNPENKTNTPFASYAWSCMERKKIEINRLLSLKKKKGSNSNLSLDALIDEEHGDATLGDTLADDFNLEEEVVNDLFYKDVLNSMSEVTRKYVNLEDLGYSQTEIGKMLGVTRAAVSAKRVLFRKKLIEELGENK